MAKKKLNDIDFSRQRLHKLYIKRSVNKDESLTEEIESLKEEIDFFDYGSIVKILT